MIYLQHMPKHGGGRLHDVQTFRASFDAESKDSATAWMSVPDEATYDSFAHAMKIEEGSVVIKFLASERLLNRGSTVAAYFRANPRRNIVVPICQFQCPHDLVKWHKPLPVKAGNGGLYNRSMGLDQMLSVVVMGHLPHNLFDYLVSQPVPDAVRVSILKQLGFTLIQLHLVDHMSHGAIGTGNIMVRIGNPHKNDYVIQEKTWSVDTEGVEPALVDFQRSIAYTVRPNIDFLVDEIAMAYYMLSRWVHWDLAELIRQVDGSITIDSLLSVIDGIV